MEEWRPVVRYEGLYEVSSEGRVRSAVTKHIKRNFVHRGYLRVDLYKKGIQSNKSVHRLVAMAFLPPAECGLTVNHMDGNKQNNYPSNLEWCTMKENTIHARDTGLSPRGEGRHNAILTDNRVLAIKKRLKNGEKGRNIAQDEQITEFHVSLIKRAVIWKHITV